MFMEKTVPTKCRLLIADDQFLIREGLKTILESEADMDVVGVARNGQEAYDQTALLLPDLVLMDIQMPIMDGITSLKKIKRDFPEIIVMILTTFDEDHYIVEGLSSGASGYILKDIESSRLIMSIRDAAAGQFMLQGTIAVKLAERIARMEHSVRGTFGFVELTEREVAVSRLVIRGFSNSIIAQELQIAEGTVRNYISTLYSKLGVNNRAAAIARLQQDYHM